MNIQISPIGQEYYQEIFEFVSKGFASGSVLHKAAGIELNPYQNYLRQSFDNAISQHLSCVAQDSRTNELLGSLIAVDYVSLSDKSEPPADLAPITALLDQLRHQYWQTRSISDGKILLVDMAVVAPSARGLGIYRKMREYIHTAGRNAGFRWVVGELSSQATQHVCINHFGHQVKAEIEYASFKYQGKRPFVSINIPRSCQLVEGEL